MDMVGMKGQDVDARSIAAAAPLLLTRDELVLLTGLTQPKRMAEWLTARGWVFEPPARRGDIPKVDRAYYTARMSGQKPAPRRSKLRLDFMLNPG